MHWVATLGRLLAQLLANRKELLVVLDRREVPLHTNGSEGGLRPEVVKRKISGGTRSDRRRAWRDTFLGLLLACPARAVGPRTYLRMNHFGDAGS